MRRNTFPVPETVAPSPITTLESISGTLTFKCLTSSFEKINSATEMKNVPPVGYDERQVVDYICFGRCPLNGLKVDWQVVEQGEERKNLQSLKPISVRFL
jgi:hypothetical protein